MATITVTQQDIDEANKHRTDDLSWDGCRLCPVAIATNKLLNKDDVVVNYTEAHVGANNVFIVPRDVRHWMQIWDAKLPVEPISFDVELLA